MLGRQVNLRPSAARGRRTIGAILLIFTLFSGLGLFLSMSSTTGAKHRAAIVQVAARQRTLAERYAKNVLLVREGAQADPGAIARVLERSAAVLLDGGMAPSVDGDDDEAHVPRENGTIARSQLKQEQRLVRDLVASGTALLANRSESVRLTAGEHLSSALSPTERLMVLTGLTSNVSLNVARTIGESEDAQLDRLMSEQVILSALGLLVFGLLSWALVTSTRRQSAHFLAQEKRANMRLRELDVMKDEFVALVSHELRTPLTAINGYTELVLDGTAGDLNDEQRSMLAAIDRSSARLFRLINDLLFVAQVNAGKLSVAIEDVDLAAVAREAIEDARPRATAAGISLDLESGVTPTVKADRVRLGQVFDNLISNAIKFTPSGGRVGLTISMVADEAIIVVTDSGMGMSPEDQQRLFTRFFRTKAAGKIQGTGLGLAITKAIVDAHRGSISVESEVGTGTSFTFSVPTSDQLPARHSRRSTDVPLAPVG